jgi:hypothetical protein
MVKVKLSLCLAKHHSMQTYGGVDVYLHACLTWALNGCKRLTSHAAAALPPGKVAPVPIG